MSELPRNGLHPELVRRAWRRVRMKYACRINPSKSEVASVKPDTLVTFVPMERVTENGVVRTTGVRRIRDVAQGFTYFREGDVLVAKITPCFENGKGGICRGLENEIGFGSTEFHVLRPIPGVLPGFIFYITRTDQFRKLGETVMYGAAGQKRVPEEFVRSFPVDLPPEEEQEAIVNFLDAKTSRINSLIGDLGKEVEDDAESKIAVLASKLREYRQTIISAAVTGKIAVPQEVAT